MNENQIIEIMRREFRRQVDEDGVNYCSELHDNDNGYCLDGDFDLRKIARLILAAAPADDWTVSASETAREVLNYLGTGSDPSLEPGADRRRDNVAKIITKHFDALAAAPASAPEPVEIKQLEWITIDKRHEAKTILGTYRALEISPGYTNLSCEVGETRFSLGDDWKQISLEAAKAAAQANFEARIRSALVTT